MTAMSMVSKSYFMFQIQNPWLIYTCIGVTLFIEIYIFCCDGGRTFPSNMILLAVFTFCEGYIVSFISSATGYQEGNSVVLLAAFMTMGNCVLYVSCCYRLYAVCVLHWRGLYNFLIGSYHIVCHSACTLYCDTIYRFAIHQELVLWCWSPLILDVSCHWHSNDHGRKKCWT